MTGNRHLEEWAKSLNQGLFPTCVAGIVAAAMAPAAQCYHVAFGGLLAGYALLVVMAFCHAPVVGDVRMNMRSWRQRNYLANDLARTTMPLRPLLQRAWPAVLGWFALSGVALYGALQGIVHG